MNVNWEQEAKYYFQKYHRDTCMLFGEPITTDELNKKWENEKEMIIDIWKKKG